MHNVLRGTFAVSETQHRKLRFHDEEDAFQVSAIVNKRLEERREHTVQTCMAEYPFMQQVRACPIVNYRK